MHYVNAKSILSAKNGMNLYRGCSHGCIYCDSRSKPHKQGLGKALPNKIPAGAK